MIGCAYQKSIEIFDISFSNAGTNPWAMMIMNFNTKTTFFTMKGPWRSQYITSRTISQHIILIQVYLLYSFSIPIIFHYTIYELHFGIIPFSTVFNMPKLFIKTWFKLTILYSVIFSWIQFILASFKLNNFLAINIKYNPRISKWTL